MPASAVLPPAVAAPPDWRAALLTQRTNTLTQLYRRTFPVVRQHVQQRGGTDQDAQDVFQDALVVLFEKAVAGTLTLTAEPGTYLAGISRHLWQRERARRARHPHLDLAAAPLADLAEADEPVPPAVLA